MIAKIIKGSNFKGVVSYILDKEKGAKILVCDGLFADSKEGNNSGQFRSTGKDEFESDEACRTHRIGLFQGG